MTRFGLDPILLLKSESQCFNDFKWIWRNELCYSPLKTWDSAEKLCYKIPLLNGWFWVFPKRIFNLPWLWKFGKRMPRVALFSKGNLPWVKVAYEPKMIWEMRSLKPRLKRVETRFQSEMNWENDLWLECRFHEFDDVEWWRCHFVMSRNGCV